MLKKVKKVCCVLLAMVLCMGMTVPTMAASSKYKAAVASYKHYMRGKSGSYLITDIDGNGIPELIFHESYYRNELRTYNPKTRKSVRLGAIHMGKGYNMSAKFSKRCHTVLLPSASTGGSTEVIYKVSGTKARKICKIESRNNKFGKPGWYINGKRVSNSTYKKTMKKYMKDSYTVYWR